RGIEILHLGGHAHFRRQITRLEAGDRAHSGASLYRPIPGKWRRIAEGGHHTHSRYGHTMVHSVKKVIRFPFTFIRCTTDSLFPLPRGTVAPVACIRPRRRPGTH